MQTLNWNSHHIDDYIMEVMALVRDVNETLATIKGNVKRTSEVLAGWVANPMFDRKEGKVSAISSLYLHQEFLSPYVSHGQNGQKLFKLDQQIVLLNALEHLVLMSTT